MVIAIIVVLVAVVFLAMGRGGGLSVERNDYVPLDLGPVSATDVALLRPPTGLWGYNMQAPDEALEQIAESLRERDVRIVALEQLVTDLSQDHTPMPLLASPYVGARHRRPPAHTADAELAHAPGDIPAASPAEPLQETRDTLAPEPLQETRDTLAPEPLQETRDAPAAAPLQAPRDTYATERVWFPFEPPRPGGEPSGPPPEQSHD